MALPKQDWYTINDAALRLKTSLQQVEHYLETGKLLASIKLPLTMLHFMDDITHHAVSFDDVEDFDDYCDIFTTELYEGIFVVTRYDRIRWDVGNSCDFNANVISLCEHVNWACLQVLKFTKSYVVRKDEIIIEEQSINRFLEKYDVHLTPPVEFSSTTSSTQSEVIPPYLDSAHARFSPELGTAISAWLAIYNSNCFKENLAHKFQIKRWVENNRRKEHDLSNEAIKRITTMVNFDKRKPRT